jgi:uncharacterized protein (TIGR02301 family)
LKRPQVILLALAALATPVAAQERRAELVAMAGVLGESQALRELCEGPRDPYWRSRMMRMLAVEEVDGPASAALTAAFNSAYGRAKGEFAACGPASRRAEADAALRGQELAAALAIPIAAAEPEPEPPADPADIAAPDDTR